MSGLVPKAIDDRREEEREGVDRDEDAVRVELVKGLRVVEKKGSIPKIDADLHPALPIRQGLDDKFMLVMSGEVGAIVLQPVYNKFTFLGRKESGSCGILWTTQLSRNGTWECKETYVVHGEICNNRHDDRD